MKQLILIAAVASHTASLDGTPLSGGTWTLQSVSSGISASINASNGTVTIISVDESGIYVVRYTHTDAVETEVVINVDFYPAGNPGNPTDPNWNTP